ncbi:MAG: glycoside hydrolase family 16 protein [Spirochaetales bacterium]|nr:glycoside hydrolase family 16 protein [Spirochaetales bacterium]
MAKTEKTFIACLILLILIFVLEGCEKKFEDKWRLVWSDEFEMDGAPDPSKWRYENLAPGSRNSEKQQYTDRPENSRVEDGRLIIEALKENYKYARYTSARMITLETATWLYGRFEIKAKIPRGRGTWPAIWMLPEDKRGYGTGWPSSGEIDIMEHVGYDQGKIHASVHTSAYNFKKQNEKTAIIDVSDCSEAFHVYALEWYEDHIDIFMDNNKYFTFVNERKTWGEWPFDKPFYLILNIAIGGDWGGQKGIDDTIFPQRMEIEYVRVYALK